MAKDPLFILMIIAMVTVVGILGLGLGAFARGGEFNRKHANRLMRYRIAAQFIAVLLFLAFVYVARG